MLDDGGIDGCHLGILACKIEQTGWESERLEVGCQHVKSAHGFPQVIVLCSWTERMPRDDELVAYLVIEQLGRTNEAILILISNL